MTLSGFLLLAVVLVVLYALLAIIFKRKENKSNVAIYVGMVMLIVIALTTPGVLKKYMYPDDPQVFKNADYHILEHRGFNFRGSVPLVDGNSCPTNAIFDEKQGSVTISKVDTSLFLDIESFVEPLYVKDPNEEDFRLENKWVDYDCSDGFTLTRKGKTVLSLIIEPYGRNKCRYIYSLGDSEVKDTSDFNKEIKKGYRLNAIVTGSSKVDIPDSVRSLLEGSLLVREIFEDASSSLVFMPGLELSTETDVAVSGVPIADEPSFHKPLALNSILFPGFGSGKSVNGRLKVDTADNGCISVRYVMPVRQHLKTDSACSIVITSSVNIAASNMHDNEQHDESDGMYLYNIFGHEDNLNHINGKVRYAVASSTDSMLFEVEDLKSFNSDVRKRIVKAGDEFTLQTTCSDLNTEREWVFSFVDMRAENKTSAKGILIGFVLVFMVCVVLRLVVNAIFASMDGYNSSVSFFEMAMYIILLSFGLVRLVLSWRSSTFVPIEDITPDAYNRMVSSALPNTSLFCCSIPILMALSSLYGTIMEWMRKLVKWIKNLKLVKWIKNRKLVKGLCEKLNGSSLLVLVLSYAILHFVCIIIGHFVLTRVFYIFMPMVLYLLWDLWLIRRMKDNDSDAGFFGLFKHIGLERPLLLLIAAALFFVADSGFSIIFLLFAMLRIAVSCLSKNEWQPLLRIVTSLAAFVAVYMFVRLEGEIMIFALNNLKVIILVLIMIVGMAVLVLLFAFGKTLHVGWKILVVCLVLAAAALGVIKIDSIVDKVSDKGIHMKYRAEVQALKEGQKVDALMYDCDFKSSDIMYIMRSAQNQWFINQYLSEGKNLDNYFKIQPHSNQGSPYNTQTTDLTVTRYVKAEHQGHIVEFMLILLLLLITIYCCEIDVCDGEDDDEDRLFLAPLLFLFIVSVSVFLSATNRTVFMGQDFPFLSLQSKIAVLLPASLMFFAASRVRSNYQNEHESDEKFHWSTGVLLAELILFSIAVWAIKPKGEEQNARQFDVDKIIDDVASRIFDLDDRLSFVQENNTSLKDSSFSAVWNVFKDQQRDTWSKCQDSTQLDNRFFASLMRYFDQKQEDKFNYGEFVYVSRRNKIYHLNVNKKFYYIDKIIDKGDPWTGDILAAKTHLDYGFSDVNNPTVQRKLKSDKEFETNILPTSIKKSVSDVKVLYFDSMWSADHKPLVLVKKAPHKESPQYFDLESDDFVYHGLGENVQMATRIHTNDILLINEKVSKREIVNLYSGRYGRDNQRYLAKNMWVNGKRQLFYPLGKESMWSFQFANLVSKVYGNSELTDSSYRHRSIRVSIDYDLHKKMYHILDSMDSRPIKMDKNLSDNIVDWLNRHYESKTKENNDYYFYFNGDTKEFVRSRRQYRDEAKVNAVIREANRRLERNDMDSNDVDNAVLSLLKRSYDFSATVVDGDGRIRLLFDFSKHGETVDPNNIRHYNKFVHDMSYDGSSDKELRTLGNMNLQYLNPGPGSTLKPVVYTAVTSQNRLDWETLSMPQAAPADAEYKYKNDAEKSSRKWLWYGGISAEKAGIKYITIDGSDFSRADNYLIKSNNRYHSLIVLLGMQKPENMMSVIGPNVQGKKGFPHFSYNGEMHSFIPEKWYSPQESYLEQSAMVNGLKENFKLDIDPHFGELYFNAFGTTPEFSVLFDQKRIKTGERTSSYPKYWVFPLKGSQRVDVRERDNNSKSWLVSAFTQMVSGSYPIAISPLQMSIMAMRLATLNAADNMTTLSDSAHVKGVNSIVDFDYSVAGWKSLDGFFSFYKMYVLNQLAKAPIEGTARVFKDNLVRYLENKGLYIYTKTGTLNSPENGRDARMKNLMVIISNTKLQDAPDVETLRKAKYYVMYLSFKGVMANSFSVAKFKPMIEAVVESEQFNHYMFNK